MCVSEGGGAVIFDPLTFTTLWANLADDNLFSRLTIGLPELSFTKYIIFLINQLILFS